MMPAAQRNISASQLLPLRLCVNPRGKAA